MVVRLIAGGDICPGDHYFSLGHGIGSRIGRGEDPFREVAGLLDSGDLCLANLEGPISPVTVRAFGPEAAAFQGPPRASALLRNAGIDFLHIANNHILQHGPEAFEITISLLGEQGITPVGMREGRSTRPVVKSIKGLTLGFLGYSLVPDPYVSDQTLYASPPLEYMIQDIEALTARVDLVVVSVHWGEEGRALPEQDVIETGHAFVSAGATLVLGHHPHWFQPVERIGGALIAYSLGDLLFDLFWDRRSVEGALLRIDLNEQGVVAHDLIPLRLKQDYRLQIQSDRAARDFLEELERMNHLLTRTDQKGSTPERSRFEVVRKLTYFLSRIHRGNTLQKMRFLLSKIREIARQFVGGDAMSAA